jgi:hypothetical protein
MLIPNQENPRQPWQLLFQNKHFRISFIVGSPTHCMSGASSLGIGAYLFLWWLLTADTTKKGQMAN